MCAGGSMFRDEHMNLYTIFKRAQLLERFGALKRRRLPFDELQKRVASKTVDALMAQIFDRCRTIARKRKGKARKVEGVAAKIDNDLNLMGGGGRRRILKWMRGSDDLDVAI